MLAIGASAWLKLKAHAEAEYPQECCGVLLGLPAPDGFEVLRIFCCSNVAEGNRREKFALDPAEQVVAIRTAREHALLVVGFYHSHPDGAAYFSKADLENSWPHYANVVLAVAGGTVVDAKSFRVDAAQAGATEEPLLVLDPA